MTKKKASIGTAAIVTAGTVLYLTFKSKHYFNHFQDWKKRKIHNIYYNSLDEQDIAWG